jgi:hypothetical protein
VLLLDVRPKSAFDAEHLSCAVHFHPTCLQRFALLSAGMSQPRAERLAAALTLGMMWMESRDVQNLIPCQVVQGPSRAATLWDGLALGRLQAHMDTVTSFASDGSSKSNPLELRNQDLPRFTDQPSKKLLFHYFSTQTCQEQANRPCEVSARNMDES